MTELDGKVYGEPVWEATVPSTVEGRSYRVWLGHVSWTEEPIITVFSDYNGELDFKNPAHVPLADLPVVLAAMATAGEVEKHRRAER